MAVYHARTNAKKEHHSKSEMFGEIVSEYQHPQVAILSRLALHVREKM
jgi:hypothetical protein